MTPIDQLTIVIPVRNGRRFLARCIAALLAQKTHRPDLAVQVVVVDNASLDGSADWLAAHYPQVTLIRNRVNRGFGGGCNDGLKAAPADIAILLNQDTEVKPGWLQAIVTAFGDPAVGIVGCKILYPDGKTIQHAGGFIQRPQQFGLHYHHHELDQGQADHSHTVEWVTGAALAVHRRVIERVGLLDEGFWPGYFEDMDYCLRARAAGFQIYYCAEAVLCHQESSSRLDFESLQRFYHRGRLRFALKHLPPQQWLDEFIAAERNDGNRSTTPRQAAYYQALVDAPELVEAYWQADDSQVQQIMAALRGLINEGSRTAQPGEKTTLAPFSDFTFPATVPWVGGLLSGFRRLWYNVAARWPVQHLQAQQSVVNQQLLDQIDALRERIHVLERNNETLQQELDQVALATAGLVQELTLLKATLPAGNDGDQQGS